MKIPFLFLAGAFGEKNLLEQSYSKMANDLKIQTDNFASKLLSPLVDQMNTEMDSVFPEGCDANSMFQCLVDRYQEMSATAGHCARINQCNIKPDHYSVWAEMSQETKDTLITQDAVMTEYLSAVDQQIASAVGETMVYKEQIAQEYAAFGAKQISFVCDMGCAMKCGFGMFIGSKTIEECVVGCGCVPGIFGDEIDNQHKISLSNFGNEDAISQVCRPWCANGCIRAGGSDSQISDCVDDCGCIYTGESFAAPTKLDDHHHHDEEEEISDTTVIMVWILGSLAVVGVGYAIYLQFRSKGHHDKKDKKHGK